MQIIIPPKLKKILTVLLLLALSAILFLAARHLFLAKPAQPTPVTPGDAQAAEQAVTAFYTLDSSEEIEAWIARVCATATASGCRAVRYFYAPSIQTLLSKYEIHTDCTAEAVELISITDDHRIWQVKVTLTNPWEGVPGPTKDVYVELSDTNGQWLMERILLEQEIQSLVTPTR